MCSDESSYKFEDSDGQEKAVAINNAPTLQVSHSSNMNDNLELPLIQSRH